MRDILVYRLIKDMIMFMLKPQIKEVVLNIKKKLLNYIVMVIKCLNIVLILQVRMR